MRSTRFASEFGLEDGAGPLRSEAQRGFIRLSSYRYYQIAARTAREKSGIEVLSGQFGSKLRQSEMLPFNVFEILHSNNF